MTNVHHLRNITPEDKIKVGFDELDQLEKSRAEKHDSVDADYFSGCRMAWLDIGSALNELRAKFSGKRGDRAFGETLKGMSAKLADMHIHAKTAAMWAASMTSEELAGHEASHPHIKVTREGGFRGLHAAVKKGRATPARSAPAFDKAREIVAILIKSGKPVNAKKIADEHGMARGTVDSAIAYEKGMLDAKKAFQAPDPVIDISKLSVSSQKRLDAAMKQELTKLKNSFEIAVQNRVSEEIDRIIEERIVSVYQKKFDHAAKVVASYKGIFTRKENSAILFCLHPDTRRNASDEKFDFAFNAYRSAEIGLLPAADTAPSTPADPENLADHLKHAVKK